MTNQPTNEVHDEPTPTEKIWKDRENELQQKHQAAMDKMYWASYEEKRCQLVGRKKQAAKWHAIAVKAHEQVKAIQLLQAQAHAAALYHSVRKAYNKDKVLKSTSQAAAR